MEFKLSAIAAEASMYAGDQICQNILYNAVPQNIKHMLSTLESIKDNIKIIKNMHMKATIQHYRSAINCIDDVEGKRMDSDPRGIREDLRGDSARFYFQNVICESTLALTDDFMDITHLILLTNMKCHAQSYCDDMKSKKLNIKDTLNNVMKNKNVLNMYYTLAFDGCDMGDIELTYAKNIANMIYTWLKVLKTSEQFLCFELKRQNIQDAFDNNPCIIINPLNPHILIKSLNNKIASYSGHSAKILIGTPCAFVCGMAWIVGGVIGSPISLVIRVGRSIVYNTDMGSEIDQLGTELKNTLKSPISLSKQLIMYGVDNQIGKINILVLRNDEYVLEF